MRPSLHLIFCFTSLKHKHRLLLQRSVMMMASTASLKWTKRSGGLLTQFPCVPLPHIAPLSHAHTHTHPSASAEAVMAPKAFTHPSVTHLCICIYISYLVQEQVMSEPHGSLKERTRLSVRAASDVTWRHVGRERACVECWMRNDYGQGMLHRKI